MAISLQSSSPSSSSSRSSGSPPNGAYNHVEHPNHHPIYTPTDLLSYSPLSLFKAEAAAYRALLHRALHLLQQSSSSTRRLNSQEIANLANAIGCFVEVVLVKEDEATAPLLHHLSLAFLAWEAEPSLTSLGSLDLAKFIGGLAKIHTAMERSSSTKKKTTPIEEWAQQGSRLMSRVVPKLTDMHLRSLTTVFRAMVVLKVVPNESFIDGAREALARLTTSSIVGGKPITDDGQLRYELMQDMIQLVASASKSTAAVVMEPSVILQAARREEEEEDNISLSSMVSAGGLAAPTSHEKRKEDLLVTAHHQHHHWGDDHDKSDARVDSNRGEGIRIIGSSSSTTYHTIASLGSTSSSSRGKEKER